MSNNVDPFYAAIPTLQGRLSTGLGACLWKLFDSSYRNIFVVSDTNGQKDVASSLHPNSNPKVSFRVEVKTLYRPVSMKLSKISLFVEALRVPFTVT